MPPSHEVPDEDKTPTGTTIDKMISTSSRRSKALDFNDLIERARKLDQ
ncbi:MAG: hypothetical protein ACR2Q4_00915 [Geminicoccaceae bacterium]